MSPAIRTAGQQLAINNDKITLSLSKHSEENNIENNKIIRKYLFIFYITFIIVKDLENITFQKLITNPFKH